tara:strand:- start:296 stop:952 length:657 start_codon:yes stop_codon:yes gene_type:complete
MKAAMRSLALIAALSGSALAEDYGTMGETFEIAEPDILEWLAARLEAAAADGSLDAMNEAFADRVERSVTRPTAVEFMRTAQEDRSWHYDPTITVPEDYADHRGVVFARAGDRVNPLDQVAMRRRYVFVDGDNADQVAWALAQYRDHDGMVSIVLTGGAPLDLMTEHQVRFYFDQKGFLTERLGIAAMPASMEQDGNRALLREYGPSHWAGLAGEGTQ